MVIDVQVEIFLENCVVAMDVQHKHASRNICRNISQKNCVVIFVEICVVMDVHKQAA